MVISSISTFRKKVSQTHDLISTAYHEVGHTICCLLLSLKVDNVAIFQNKKTKRIEGYCKYFDVKDIKEVEDKELINHLLISELIVKYAGLTCEKYFFQTISGCNNFPLFLRDGSSNDTLEASKIIKNHNLARSGKERYAFKKNIINYTLTLLKSHWDDVVLLTHYLFKNNNLSYVKIKDFLEKKSNNKSFWKKQFKKINYLFENKVQDSKIKTLLIS